MTKIYIKGILGKKFGSYFNFNISNIDNAIKAIDANRNGFIKELFNLNKKNINYFLIADGQKIETENCLMERKKIKNIYIIPAIIGSGDMAAFALNLTEIAANGAVVLSTAGIVVSSLVNILISTAISLGVSLLMQALNKEAAPPQQNIVVGGVTSAIEAKGKSYVFSNNLNSAEQGSSIPIGYGRMISASKILSMSIKNYSTDQIALNEYKVLQNSSAYLDFLTN
jgi:predicted phage tail protein